MRTLYFLKQMLGICPFIAMADTDARVGRFSCQVGLTNKA
jgi:hypothetical protein